MPRYGKGPDPYKVSTRAKAGRNSVWADFEDLFHDYKSVVLLLFGIYAVVLMILIWADEGEIDPFCLLYGLVPLVLGSLLFLDQHRKGIAISSKENFVRSIRGRKETELQKLMQDFKMDREEVIARIKLLKGSKVINGELDLHRGVFINTDFEN